MDATGTAWTAARQLNITQTQKASRRCSRTRPIFGHVMPDALVSGDLSPPPVDRTKLAAAIERHRQARDRLSALEAARPRAMEARHAASSVLEEAEQALAAARDAEPHRLVADFLAGSASSSAGIAEASAALDKARADYARQL